MLSNTEICNIALSHTRTGVQIGSLTEDTEEALACNQFYELAKKATLRDHKWSFATYQDKLNLIKEQPTEEWNYSYRLPPDMLKIWRVLSYLRKDHRYSRVSYKLFNDGGEEVLYTDKEDASIEYTKDISNSNLFTDDFIIALSYRLAYYISSRVIKGDHNSLKKELLELYQFELRKAIKNSNQEVQDDIRQPSTFIRARKGVGLYGIYGGYGRSYSDFKAYEAGAVGP